MARRVVSSGTNINANAGVVDNQLIKLARSRERNISWDVIDDRKVEGILEKLGRESFGDQKVVFSQSHPDGTLAMKGTEIDLTLVPRKKITFGVFKEFHIGLAEKNLVEMKSVMDNEHIKAILLKVESDDDLTASDKAQMEQILGEAGHTISFNDTKQDESHKTLIQTLIHAKPLYADG
ncbi:MAG: hypothetical protein GY847_09045 [Proteobacteria bacterium]|nr:hypothetical protein [Pseudomonadota bacterium]